MYRLHTLHQTRLEQAKLIWKNDSSSGKGQSSGLMKNLNFIMYFFFFAFFKIFRFYFYIYIYILFWGFILRSKIKLNIISLSHTIIQVLQSRRRLIFMGSCSCSRLRHTSNFHSHSHSRFKSCAPVAYENQATRWWVSKDRWKRQEVIFIDNKQIKCYYY